MQCLLELRVIAGRAGKAAPVLIGSFVVGLIEADTIAGTIREGNRAVFVAMAMIILLFIATLADLQMPKTIRSVLQEVYGAWSWHETVTG